MVRVNIVPDIALEYRVDISGISAQEAYDLDVEAIQNAKVRYSEHLTTIIKKPLLNEDGLDYWWLHKYLNRKDSFDRFYYFYFNIAKLRLVWDRYGFEEVHVDCELNRKVEAGLKYFCDQVNVNFRNVYRLSINNLSFFIKSKTRKNLYHVIRLKDAFARLFFRRLICWIYNNKIIREGGFPVIFLSKDKPNHEIRFGIFPELLKERGFDPLHVLPSLTGPGNLLSALIDLITNRPYLHLYWFESPVSEMNKRKTTRIMQAYNDRIREIRELDDSSEWVFLMDQYANFSESNLRKDFQRLEDYAQVMERLNTKLWIHSWPPVKVFSKFVAAIAKNCNQDVYVIAPHLFSKTRTTNHLLTRELPQSKYSSFPNGIIVQDNISRDNLIACGLPESYICLTKIPKSRIVKPGGSSQVDCRREGKLNILVALQKREENPSIFETIYQSLGQVKDLHIIFKPHPFHLVSQNWLARMMRGAQFSYQLVDPISSLDLLSEKCDIGMTIYSTAALNIARGGKPVVWVPYVSVNHVFAIDLVERFGVVAYDGPSLKKTVLRLRDDRDYYEQQVERSLLAVNSIVPEEQQLDYPDAMEFLVKILKE